MIRQLINVHIKNYSRPLSIAKRFGKASQQTADKIDHKSRIEELKEEILDVQNLPKLLKRSEIKDLNQKSWRPRAPVVTIMGHIDHGKTSLLDALRKSNRAAQEAGAITQHIGAFSVHLKNQEKITFLDTPGHAVFTSMRARGAKITDIVVLVVSAEDGIKPQTVEAIRHAKAAQVSIIVAVNKCDLPKANPEKVKKQLMEYELQPEEYGGDVPCIEVSAKTGKGLDDLEEMISAMAEILELKADYEGKCEATVIESSLQKGKGTVATILVQHGSLKPGSILVLNRGNNYVKIRTIQDENGKSLTQALPSTPCEISGTWIQSPKAGDECIQVADEESAKTILKKIQFQKEQIKQLEQLNIENQYKLSPYEEKLQLYERRKAQIPRLRRDGPRHVYVQVMKECQQLQHELNKMKTAPNDSSNTEKNEIRELLAVVKGDVHGSVEAVIQSLENLANSLTENKASKGSQEKVNIKVLHSAPGPISPSDIELLASVQKSKTAELTNTQSVLIGFNIPQPSKSNYKLLQNYQIPLISSNIIYKLMDEVQELLTGMLSPEFVEDILGEAQVQALFHINNGKDFVAGCRVTSGILFKSQLHSNIKHFVLRQGKKIYEGQLKSLKHFKQDVDSISNGKECGLSFGNDFKDFQVGDVIQSVKIETVKITKE